MSNDVALFDPTKGMPAHVGSFFEDQGTNIENRATVPSLSPQGKQWTIALDGNKTVLQKKNADGDMEPVSILRVVILDYAKRRGRAYYEGAYDPAKESAPICWSDDGVAPDDSLPTLAPGVEPTPGAPRKISSRCDSCPMAAKGSKVSEQGKALTACSQHRMLAVVPANKLDFEPLRLKIAITSDFDKQSPDAEAQGWYAFSNFLDYLKSRGVQHTAALVAKMKFDANAAYPKIFFAADRWLTPEELAVVAPLTKDPKVVQLLGGTWTPAGPDGVKREEAAAQAPAAERTLQEKMADVAKTATPAAAAEPEESPAQKALREAQEALAKEEAEKAAKAAPAKQADEDDGEIVGLDAPPAKPEQGPAQGAAEAPAKASPEKPVDPALADLLAEWTD